MEDTETENDPMEQLLQRRKFLFLSPDLEPILNPSDVNKSLTKLIIINTKFADKIRKCKLGVGNSHKQTVLQHAANSHKQNKITVQNCCQLSQANLLDLPKVLPIVTSKLEKPDKCAAKRKICKMNFNPGNKICENWSLLGDY